MHPATEVNKNFRSISSPFTREIADRHIVVSGNVPARRPWSGAQAVYRQWPSTNT
jgi:hypothetical protein